MANQSQVIENWVNGIAGRAGALSTDGYLLRSYELVIGIKNGMREPLVADYTAKSNNYVSMTTSHHVSAASSVAKAVPVNVFERMAKRRGVIQHLEHANRYSTVTDSPMRVK